MIKDLRIVSTVDKSLKYILISIIKDFCDCFCKEVFQWSIVGCELAIYTGNENSACRNSLSYETNEFKFIILQIVQLLENGCILECTIPWFSMIVIVAKPQEEHVDNIGYFIWQMWVHYRKIKSTPKPLNFIISQCNYTIAIIGGGSKNTNK